MLTTVDDFEPGRPPALKASTQPLPVRAGEQLPSPFSERRRTIIGVLDRDFGVLYATGLIVNPDRHNDLNTDETSLGLDFLCLKRRKKLEIYNTRKDT